MVTFPAGSAAALAEAAAFALLGDPPASVPSVAPSDALAPVLAAYQEAGVLARANLDNSIFPVDETTISHLAIASAAPAEAAAAGET